jgi:hypothetical protein
MCAAAAATILIVLLVLNWSSTVLVLVLVLRVSGDAADAYRNYPVVLVWYYRQYCWYPN